MDLKLALWVGAYFIGALGMACVLVASDWLIRRSESRPLGFELQVVRNVDAFADDSINYIINEARVSDGNGKNNFSGSVTLEFVDGFDDLEPEWQERMCKRTVERLEKALGEEGFVFVGAVKDGASGIKYTLTWPLQKPKSK